MTDLPGMIAALAAERRFSGVVRVDEGGELALDAAFGFADRRWGIANTVTTRFGIASGSKGFTALVVMSLVQEGVLALDTPARSLLRDDLPLVDDRVTIEHLLGHRSGIGDYLDEEAGPDVTEPVMPVPVHLLETTEQFLAVLDGYPMVSAPGDRFVYNNGGLMVLALIAERAAGVPFHDLVEQRVCAPAGLRDTAYLRSDALPGGVAVGYLYGVGEGDDLRTNVLHLPVRGNGDGGAYSTTADFRHFWEALFASRIVAASTVAEMVRPRSTSPRGLARYGLGFWLHLSGPSVNLEGHDAGVSFRSTHDPTRGLTHTVISNTSEGAWPLVDALDELLGT